jgi:hypothetical protein
MLVDRYPAEDAFARVPELAEYTDPVLVQLDPLLSDAVVASPLTPLLRFTRGFSAGLAVGLLLGGAAISFYDAAHESVSRRNSGK